MKWVKRAIGASILGFTMAWALLVLLATPSRAQLGPCVLPQVCNTWQNKCIDRELAFQCQSHSIPCQQSSCDPD